MPLEHPVEAVIETEADGGVGLQLYAFVETVQINAGYNRELICLKGFSGDYGCQH